MKLEISKGINDRQISSDIKNQWLCNHVLVLHTDNNYRVIDRLVNIYVTGYFT